MADPPTPPNPSAPLEKLNLDVFDGIGSFLKASELDGATRASKRLRKGFARSMFYSVRFSGDQKRLSLMLKGFMSLSDRNKIKEITKWMRHVSVIVGYGESDNDSARVLGVLIICVLGRIPGLSALNLDVWRLSPAKQRQMCLQLRLTPHWPPADIQSLRVDADLDVLKLLAIKIPPRNLKAMHLSEGINSPHFEMIKESFPQIKRLSISLYQTQPPNSPYAGVLIGEDQMNSIGQDISNNFQGLEWLVLSQIYHDRGPWLSPDYSPLKKTVTNLTKDLEKMKHLRRFALALPRMTLKRRIFPSETEDVELLGGRITAKIRILISLFGERLPKAQQICFIDHMMPCYHPVVYRGTRVTEGEEMTVRMEINCHRDAFPLGLLY